MSSYIFSVKKHVVEGVSDEANSTFEEDKKIKGILTKELTNTVTKKPRNKKKAVLARDTNDDKVVEGKDKQCTSKYVRHVVFNILSVPE